MGISLKPQHLNRYRQIGWLLAKYGHSDFESKPMASASLGQVHLARLRDGRPVAVKVQRPNIREQMVEDLDALGDIAEFLDNHSEFGQRYEFTRMLEELRKSLMRELDY